MTWKLRSKFVRHHMDSEQRASMGMLEAVSPDRDVVRQETHNFSDIYQISESAAQFTRAELNLTESYRMVAE